MSTTDDHIPNQTGRSKQSPLPTVVTSSKGSSAYQVHSYPTKIPPEAIVPFIEASTSPGAVVLDPFCGSGMTGLAAQMSGRSAILSDLSPGAVHLAGNQNTVGPSDAILEALSQLDAEWMRQVERQLYPTTCPTCDFPGVIRHMIWSEVHTCDHCHSEIVLWDQADPYNRSVPRTFDCPDCHKTVTRAGSHATRIQAVRKVVACTKCKRLQEGEVSTADQALLAELAKRRLRYWIPKAAVEPSREMYKRSALHLRGIKTVEDFYLPRAKHALTRLWNRIGTIEQESVRNSLRLAFTNTAWHASRMRRYNAKGGQRPMTGTLYIPQLSAEANVFEVFRNQARQVASFAADFARNHETAVISRQSTAADLSWLPDNSIDYVFTDPPFGSNIFYGDCNIVWEAWLGETTDTDREMVVNKSRTAKEGGKDVDDYEDLLAAAFGEIRRVLRPAARASIVFHNSDDKVWSALVRAAERAGLKQTDVSILDKGQRSMKGYRGKSGRELVTFYDLVITFTSGRIKATLNGAGEIALDAIRRHLADSAHLEPDGREHSLEFLYSVAVGAVVASGSAPDGLSYRAFEQLCNENFDRRGQYFTAS